jgi:hypothetical protein
MGSFLTHTINRDTTERYQVLISDDAIVARNLRNGAQVPITFKEGAKAYLSCGEPAEDLRAITVADYTFILNRTKKVQTLPDEIGKYRPAALIWVKQGAFGSTYSITINGTTVSFKTASRSATEAEWTAGKRWLNEDGTTDATIPATYQAAPPRELPQHITQVNATTDRIAKGLFDLLRLNPSFIGKFLFTRNGSLIRVWSVGITDGDTTQYPDFVLSATDSQGDTILKTFKDRVQSFSELPQFCFNGYRVKVMGDGATEFDDYYVRYEGDKTGGVWVEDIADEELYKLDPSTMPHALVRQADGSFSFEALPWEPRKAGNSKSNPLPSLVGKRVRDVFFYRDRLGMVSQENVVMSRYGDYFNLFKASATELLDTDPIDVSISHYKVSDINHALSYNGTLLLLASEVQFQIAPVDLLTPKTVAFNQTTEFVIDPTCRPVGVGSNLYFTNSRGSFTAVHEYYVDSESSVKDANDVTAHVPRFIPANVNQLVVCQPENMLVALSKNRKNSLYVYGYFWNGPEKMMSSWSRWDFPTDSEILSISFIESVLWMTLRRGGKVVMESMDLAPGATSSGLPFMIHLDRQATQATGEIELEYNAALNITDITVPYPVLEDTILLAQEGNPEFAVYEAGRRQLLQYQEGEQVEYTASTRGGRQILTVVGNLTKFWIGRTYTMEYKFSPILLRQDSGAGDLIATTEGRLQLRNLALDYAGSGYFRVEIDAVGRDTNEYQMTAKTIGSQNLRLNRLRVETGTFRVPIYLRNTEASITIINDSPLPSTILSATWEGHYSTKIRKRI